jgi:hypothetical protein
MPIKTVLVVNTPSFLSWSVAKNFGIFVGMHAPCFFPLEQASKILGQ